MKICITSKGKTLDSIVDLRFGRCECFVIVDTGSMEFEAFDNPSNSSTGGAGIVAGQFLATKGVKAVLTGNVGPNAFQTLEAAKIDIYTGMSGLVKEAVERYKSGELKPVKGPSVGSKFGIK
ncbi:MAG: NifB/NifX family molybdenum-iron cluster-binding protein [Candidatus Omnitrophota bacterium]